LTVKVVTNLRQCIDWASEEPCPGTETITVTTSRGAIAEGTKVTRLEKTTALFNQIGCDSEATSIQKFSIQSSQEKPAFVGLFACYDYENICIELR
jgi:hypothetical protein